jgi:hypothetical protein
VGHIPEDILDEFVMEMLSEQDCAFWEEHMLICHTCQDRLAESDEYVGLMKSATFEIFDPETDLERPSLATAARA